MLSELSRRIVEDYRGIYWYMINIFFTDFFYDDRSMTSMRYREKKPYRWKWTKIWSRIDNDYRFRKSKCLFKWILVITHTYSWANHSEVTWKNRFPSNQSSWFFDNQMNLNIRTGFQIIQLSVFEKMQFFKYTSIWISEIKIFFF